MRDMRVLERTIAVPLLLLTSMLPALARAEGPTKPASLWPAWVPVGVPVVPTVMTHKPPADVPAVAPSPPAPAPPSVPAVPAPMPQSGPIAPERGLVLGNEKANLRFAGFVALQLTFDTNETVKQNHLISVDGQGTKGRIGYAFDATRLNLVGRLATHGVGLEGRVEVDFQNAIHFRIRHAYAAVTKGRTTILLGQTDTLIGNQVGPHNFNNDWLYSQGNAYDRVPQLRLSHDRGRLLLAVALLPNSYGATDFIPHLQGRALLRFGQGRGILGAAIHFGYSNRVKNPADANQEVGGVISYLASVDGGVTAGPVQFSVQIWVGAGGAHGTGGQNIGNPLFVVNAGGQPVSVPSAGGFFDIFWKTRTRLSLGLAGGASIITDTTPGGVRVPVSSNLTGVLYATFALRPNWIFDVEAQGARTTRALDSTRPDLYMPLYDVRVLFGQKYSF